MSRIGILAYGSLIPDPGREIGLLIRERIDTQTPFGVEFGRYSRTRGEAPTVVSHPLGGPVKAQVLVLDSRVSLAEARDLLWRRETRKENSRRSYPAGRSPNAVLVRDIGGSLGLEHVLYTDFNDRGKIRTPDPVRLAQHAITSIKTADSGKDGISYLIALLEAGVETPLTPEYVRQILLQTGSETLEEAHQKCRDMQRGMEELP